MKHNSAVSEDFDCFRAISHEIKGTHRDVHKLIILNSITTIAMTSKIWMKPPMVYEVIIPSNHKIIITTAMV
jgi:hypothetical protein